METPQRVTTIVVQTTDLMTMATAAGALGVHRMTLYRWLEDGKLHAIKLDGVLFVPRSEVERIKAAEAKAKTEA